MVTCLDDLSETRQATKQLVPAGVLKEIFGWGCVAGTLEPLAAHTRASSAEFCNPILDSPNSPYPRVAFRLNCVHLNLQI